MEFLNALKNYESLLEGHLKSLPFVEEYLQPVSYTHLDVYKRQVRAPERRLAQSRKFSQNAFSSTYTLRLRRDLSGAFDKRVDCSVLS